MPSRATTFLVCCSLVIGSSGIARAEQPKPKAQPASKTKIELFNPVAFLSQVIASVLGEPPTQTVSRMSFGPHISAAPLPSAMHALTVQFAPAGDAQTVALVLAESQVRVKLTRDWLLRCEVASREEPNAEAELQVDLGLQFKFE